MMVLGWVVLQLLAQGKSSLGKTKVWLQRYPGLALSGLPRDIPQMSETATITHGPCPIPALG